MLKSIKELADEIGVSKTAVRNKIANLSLHSSLRKNGNLFVIDENTQKLIKGAFSETNAETKTQSKTETANNEVFALINVLEKELESKNTQIAELQKALDQSQKLQAMNMQKLQALEDKQADEETENIKKRWYQFWK